MAILTVSEELRVLLARLTQRTEIRDSEGKVLGTFTPQNVLEDEMYEAVIKSFNLREAERRLAEFLASGAKGFTSEEVLAELESLQRTEPS